MEDARCVYRASIRELSSSELHALFHHPTTLSCRKLELFGFAHRDANMSVEKLRFDWADIRLPALTHLVLCVISDQLDTGDAAFVASLTALLEIEANVEFASITELTVVFQDPTTLPLLTHLL